jgi:uncharacterized OsmC-like protein
MAKGRASLNDVNLAAVGALVERIRLDPGAATTHWKSEVRWKTAFKSEAKSRDLPPTASDEPSLLGGNDSAPNPVEQLLGALGNCLAVGYAANASAEGILIRSLELEVEGDIDLRTFLGLAGDNAGFAAIRVKVHIDSDASREALERLHIKVVGTSPVGHTLERPVSVRVDLL